MPRPSTAGWQKRSPRRKYCAVCGTAGAQAGPQSSRFHYRPRTGLRSAYGARPGLPRRKAVVEGGSSDESLFSAALSLVPGEVRDLVARESAREELRRGAATSGAESSEASARAVTSFVDVRRWVERR